MIDKTEEACLKQSLLHAFTIHCLHILLTEVNILLLCVAIYFHAKHFATFATHNSCHLTTDGRGKPYIGTLFIDKQRIPGLDHVTLFYNDFRNHSRKSLRRDAYLALGSQRKFFFFCLAFQVNV